MSIVILHKFVEVFLYTLSIAKLGSPLPPANRRMTLTNRPICVGVCECFYSLRFWKAGNTFYSIRWGEYFGKKIFFILFFTFAWALQSCRGFQIRDYGTRDHFQFRITKFKVDKGPIPYPLFPGFLENGSHIY